MFQFAGFPPAHYGFMRRYAGSSLRGFPHSDTRGSPGICPSPRLFAACRVFHRPPVPRHPPCALSCLAMARRIALRRAAFLHFLVCLSWSSLLALLCMEFSRCIPPASPGGIPVLFLTPWRPPAFPCRPRHSILGRPRLNRRVRDVYGCAPRAHRHQNRRPLPAQQWNKLYSPSLERR